MKNKSFKVIEYGFPKLGTVLDLGLCYNAYVIGYEKPENEENLKEFH